MKKDFWLILNLAAAVGAHMPATQAAFEINAAQSRKETSKTSSARYSANGESKPFGFYGRRANLSWRPSGEAGLNGMESIPSYAFGSEGRRDSTEGEREPSSRSMAIPKCSALVLRDILGLTGSNLAAALGFAALARST